MKVKWGQIISEGRGKLGGLVASRNRSGSYMRTKVSPSNPQSVAQTEVRNYLTSVSQAWRGLTSAQRLAWNNAVASFKSTNIFGDGVTPSGFNLYSRLNQNLKLIGASVITTPPLPANVPAFTSCTITPDFTTGDFEVAFAPAIGATENVLVYATPGVSAGKSFVKSEYRLIEILDTADVTPYDITTSYTAAFGALPAVGTKAFVKMRQVVIASGLSSSFISASEISV